MPFAGIAGGSPESVNATWGIWVFTVVGWGFENVCSSSNKASSAFSGRWLLSEELVLSPPMMSGPTRVPEGGCVKEHHL